MRNVFLMTCLVFVVLFAACNRDNTSDTGSNEAPDFSFTDAAGNKARLSDFRGKVVMLEFWATWCPPCIEAAPAMKTVYGKYKDRGFVLLGISVDKGHDAGAKVTSFVKEKALTYPVFLDDENLSAAYGANSIPTSLIIDKKGRIAVRHTGFIPDMAETLSQEIEALL